ncbi:MAG TPA: Hsp20/alpha crystallin family protein, partial [Bellilinea sp.]|nr:Hsp20/alpha crystallin family protein [Bellilinea sp.]
SNLTRWEPVREMMTLREAMDRLFDDAFTRPFNQNGISSLPSLDVYETADELVVKAVVPGLKAEDVNITVTNDMLTLRGEYKQENGNKGNLEATYHIREWRGGAFERSIRLPVEVQTDRAKADFENGILTISLPKAETVKPRTITVKAK